MHRRRVVITGIGMQTPVGLSTIETWSALLQGRSGIGAINVFDAAAFPTRIAGEIRRTIDPAKLDIKRFRKQDRFAQLALAAAAEAIDDADLGSADIRSERKAVCLGSGVGGLGTFEVEAQQFLQRGPSRISPFMIPKMMPNAASAAISIEFGLHGPALTLSSACASSSDAIIAACDLIRSSRADVVIAGGAESTITPVALGGFVAARALSQNNANPEQASRPFDEARDGFVLSEGACVLIVEELENARKRGAKIYVEVGGGGQSSDAYHITAPLPDGAGATRAMRAALEDAQLATTDVGYINAHATSTSLGDLAEIQAIRAVFAHHSSQLFVNGTKSLIGHTLGASGAIAVAVTALSMRDSVVHGTLNCESPEKLCNFRYVGPQSQEVAIRHALVNSFGFGGHNTSIVLSKI